MGYESSRLVPAESRADQVEDVAAMSVKAAHRIDEVGALEAGEFHQPSGETGI